MPLLTFLASVLAFGLLASPAQAALGSAWKAIPARVPADSLPGVLLGIEAHGAPGVRPGEAAYALGQFRYARGEYEAAVGPFLRAYARLTGHDRIAARYAHGLASLAMGNAAAARASFLEVAESSPELRSLARLGVAQAWDAEKRPEKAYDTLRALLSVDAGEAGPPALERFAALASLYHHEAEARAARARLARQYPRSIEAARQGAIQQPGGALDDGAAPARTPAP